MRKNRIQEAILAKFQELEDRGVKPKDVQQTDIIPAFEALGVEFNANKFYIYRWMYMRPKNALAARRRQERKRKAAMKE